MRYYLFNTSEKNKITLSPGVYRFECWGAQGGKASYNAKYVTEGGKGAYVSGDIILNHRRNFFLYIGGKGGDASINPNIHAPGGFNGGGNGGADTDNDDASGGGGGSTDIRLVDGEWDNTESILSRIIVAAGGSGACYNVYGAPGGTLNGFVATGSGYEVSSTSQIYGYHLGIGQEGVDHDYIPSSGAGGGYFGGLASPPATTETAYGSVSSSGSSFVSGCDGCISHDRDGQKTESSVHFSKLVFKNIIMKSGNNEFNTPLGQTTTGNSGDGAIKIILLYAFSIGQNCRLNTNKLIGVYIMLIYS